MRPKAKLLEEKYELKRNWNFLGKGAGGEGVQNRKPSVRGVWIFSGTTQWFTGNHSYTWVVRDKVE